MTTNLIQGDLDTLFTAASTTDGSTPGGPYNVVGTSTGEFASGRLSTDFEKNLACIVALTEFLIANTSNPATSAVRFNECRVQRKTLKDLLASTATKLGTTPGVRATDSDRAIDRMIANFNNNNRPDVVVS